MSSNALQNGAEASSKKRDTSRLHTRANRSVPFFVAEPLIKKHMPDKMRTQHISLYFTVPAEEMLIDLLERSSKYVPDKGVTKKGKRKGRIKAEHIAKALADKSAPFYGVLPEKVAGEFVKDEEFRSLLLVSSSSAVEEQQDDDDSGRPKKKPKKRPPAKKAAAKVMMELDPEEPEEEPEADEDEDDAAAVAEEDSEDSEDSEDEEEDEEDDEDDDVYGDEDDE